MNRISIITICFNNPADLAETCKSVDLQDEKPFEHLVIDGSTTPGTRDFLENREQPPYRRWIIERDRGISDAFNKGILNAKGEIVVMLNSGDTLYDRHALAVVSKRFQDDSRLQWLHGKYQLHRGNSWIIIGKPFESSKMYRGMRSIRHQTMFVKKALHDKYGLYDIDMKIAMDYDFLLRIAPERFTFVDTPLVTFAPAGTSSVQYLNSLKEIRSSYEKYYGKSVLLNLWQARLKFLYRLLNTSFGKFLFKIKTRLKLENM